MTKVTRIDPVATSPVKKKLRVAAYCRVSTGMDDQLVSLEVQREHYEAYISANPEWEFAGVYYDQGITGTRKEKRPALMRMISDCEAGKIDYIVTKSLSRFARNTTDCLELVRKLLGLGISIYFEKENLDTGSMESELLLSIMGSLAESESVSISENNKLGARYRFENGTYKNGYAPFGYMVKDGEFHINEEEAQWVRFIFAEALSGKSTRKIAKALNEKGVPARKGDHWGPSTVGGILRNEKYVGDCLQQKMYSDFRFQKHVNRGQRDQFLIEGHHEAIISREDFEAAGRMLQGHRKGATNHYPFTGKIVCGECGTAFSRRTDSDGNPIWACRKHIREKDVCHMQSVTEEALEYAFCTMMNKLAFARKEVLQDLLDAILQQQSRSGLRRVDEIDAALEGIVRRRQELTAIMTRGYISPAAFTKETNNLFAEAAALEDEREQLVRGLDGDMHKTEALRDILKHNGQLTEFDAELFGRFVDRITVCSREEAVFHLKCGLELKERIG